MLSRFQRVTSSGNFIPQIDGLRFIAIFSVIFYHLNEDILKKNTHKYLDNKLDYSSFNNIVANGNRGVQLFFAISGFILALPFALHYINGLKKPGLKSYFLRRLTRLEPPYILIMVVLFLAAVFIVKKVTFHDLFPSLLSSLTYTNNFFNYNSRQPFVNVVAWSLEIEVQFYILAPLMALVFKLRPIARRLVILSVIVIFPFIHSFITLPFKSLLDFIQFFATGFLLADLYVSENKKLVVPEVIAAISGLVLLILIWLLPVEPGAIFYNVCFPLIILGFFYTALFSAYWKRLLSIRLITVIGGMCYSIYLIHFAIISILDNVINKRVHTSYYLGDLLVQFFIVIPAIILVSAIFFLFIEKPCMNKNWPKKLMAYIRADVKKSD